MEGLLAGKASVVTGAGRGIGKAIAATLAAEGARVVLASRTKAALDAVKGEIESAGGEVLAVPTDVADEAAVKGLIAAGRDAYGRLDILINNAGITLAAPLAETTTEEWDRVMAVNARGPFLLCREAIPLMKTSGGGTIINIASVVGVKGYVNQSAYTASKHALMGMTKVLAQEVRADGIRVHAICPGGVATDLIGQVRPDIEPDALMSPREIADIVLFLLTRKGNGVIDQINVRRAASEPWF